MKPKNTPTKSNNWTLPVILASLIIIAILWKVYDHKSDNAEPQTRQTQFTTAQKLASLDANSPAPLSADDERVKQVDDLLNTLAATYHETTDAIGNATYVASQQLKRKGITESNHDILQHMSTQAPIQGLAYKPAVLQYAASVKQ